MRKRNLKESTKVNFFKFLTSFVAINMTDTQPQELSSKLPLNSPKNFRKIEYLLVLFSY